MIDVSDGFGERTVNPGPGTKVVIVSLTAIGAFIVRAVADAHACDVRALYSPLNDNTESTCFFQ